MTTMPKKLINNGPNLRPKAVLPLEAETKFQSIETEFDSDSLSTYKLVSRKKILIYGSKRNGKMTRSKQLAVARKMNFFSVQIDSSIYSSNQLEMAVTFLKEELDGMPAKSFPMMLFIECGDLIQGCLSPATVKASRLLIQFIEEYQADGLLVISSHVERLLDVSTWLFFDDLIKIEKPGKREIQLILQQEFSSFQTTVDWENIADKMLNFSAAEVVRLADYAKWRAVEIGITNTSGTFVLGQKDVENALEQILPYRQREVMFPSGSTYA